MASFISALNAKIRSQPVLNYVCSTHFWGPMSNFGIPVAAVMDTQKDAEIISGKMTGVLCIYSATFMRYALAVQPKNYLLFACHAVNEGAQLMQGYRYLDYWNWGGRERALQARALADKGADKAEGVVREGVEKGKGVVAEVKDKLR
ncbi:MAG: pyruvate transporter mpc1 [Thelocarpon impressellum]|nr:MAG: pyruvate transporter mpc1 [Thelocarpon impressellum]